MDVDDTLSEQVADAVRARLAYRRRRGQHPTSARDLAVAIGISQSAMSARLTGATPIDLNELEKIAAALGVEVAALFPAPKKVDRLAYPGPPVRTSRPRTTADLLIGHPADHPHPSRAATRTTPRRPAIRPYRHEGVPA